MGLLKTSDAKLMKKLKSDVRLFFGQGKYVFNGTVPQYSLNYGDDGKPYLQCAYRFGKGGIVINITTDDEYVFVNTYYFPGFRSTDIPDLDDKLLGLLNKEAFMFAKEDETFNRCSFRTPVFMMYKKFFFSIAARSDLLYEIHMMIQDLAYQVDKYFFGTE